MVKADVQMELLYTHLRCDNTLIVSQDFRVKTAQFYNGHRWVLEPVTTQRRNIHLYQI